MKKATAVLIFILILATFALTPSLAAGNIVITHQPQNGTFPENSAASWSVEAAGDNLSYHWFIVYKGVTYDTNKSFAEGHPWQDGVVGSGYGSNDKGNTFFINGIGSVLDGGGNLLYRLEQNRQRDLGEGLYLRRRKQVPAGA